jgi:hypothetical protein
MKMAGKYTALSFALLLPALLAGCKSKPVEVMPSAAETRVADNPFVGLWVLEPNKKDGDRAFARLWSWRSGTQTPDDRSYRFVYKFTNTNRWELYTVADGKVMPELCLNGTYKYRGSVLCMIYKPQSQPEIWPFIHGSEPTWSSGSLVVDTGKLDGDVIKFYVWRYFNEHKLRRVSADCGVAE